MVVEKMSRAAVMRIQRNAKALMVMSPRQIAGFRSRASIIYYYILEDANWHAENNVLTRNGVFGAYSVSRYDSGDVYSPKSYGSKYAEALWKKYRAAGGKSWEL